MTEPIEETYFNWLYSKVASTFSHTPSLTYWNLIRLLHGYEFVWLVQGDDNRATDGLELRREFSIESGIRGDSAWETTACSVMEMLIALSRRAEFLTGTPLRDWFWTMLRHLGLEELNDAHPNISRQVLGAMERFVWRTYKRSGKGGLFPLTYTDHDQTQVEIWYQFNEYLYDQRLL